METKIIETLQALRLYAIQRGITASFFYHEEESSLMRFANSAISLNTNEHLVRLEITTFDGKKRASYEMITDLEKIDEMKAGIDTAAGMMEHTQSLSYQPSVPVYPGSFEDTSCYDEGLATITNEERLAYFNQAAAGLENESITLSGIFSSGTNITAMINTRSEHYQLFKTSDAQINVVLAHAVKKWEVLAEQSAQQKSDLDPGKLHGELAYLLHWFTTVEPQKIDVGEYDIVFGSSAIGDMLGVMNWVGFNGGYMRRGYSFIRENQVGEKLLSSQFSLTDDPSRRETFPNRFDYCGIPRTAFPLFADGVFQQFTWYQDDADEFGVAPTGHTVGHNSLVMKCGDVKVRSLKDLVELPRERDLLYIPFLHYMNLVNPSLGVITGSSRFGALLLRKDGSVAIPFNVRLTQSLLDIFGEKLAWLSNEEIVVNTSASYGARSPVAIILPAFIRVNGLEISHANTSF